MKFEKNEKINSEIPLRMVVTHAIKIEKKEKIINVSASYICGEIDEGSVLLFSSKKVGKVKSIQSRVLNTFWFEIDNLEEEDIKKGEIISNPQTPPMLVHSFVALILANESVLKPGLSILPDFPFCYAEWKVGKS